MLLLFLQYILEQIPTFSLSRTQENWVFKVNIPLLEKVDKLIWCAPCCSVGSDRDQPVNLRNEGLLRQPDGSEIEQHIS